MEGPMISMMLKMRAEFSHWSGMYTV